MIFFNNGDIDAYKEHTGCIGCHWCTVCFAYRLPNKAQIATETDLICNMKLEAVAYVKDNLQ